MGAFLSQNIVSIIFGFTTVITSVIALRYKRLDHELRVERILDEGRRANLFLSREAMIKYLLEMYDQAEAGDVIVPNAQVTSDTIKNYSANDKSRVDIVTSISYDDNISRALDTLMDIMTNHDLVLADPAATVDVLELADSSVNLAVRCWASTDDYWSVRCFLLEEIKTRFDEDGIIIPYPQQEIAIRGQNGLGIQ